MKRKNWKRTAAFVTSVTMATTMMPAELGSVLVNAATADEPNADHETGVLNWATTKYTDNKVKKSFITALKVNGNLQSNVISNNAMDVVAGDKVEITSEVPLTISSKFGGAASDSFEIALYDKGEGKYQFGEITKEGNEFKKNGTVISADDALAEIFTAAGYDISDETFTYKWKNEEKNAVEVKFAAKETKNSNGTYTYSFTMPDDNGKTADGNGLANPMDADTIAVESIERNIAVNFYENEDIREEDDRQSGATKRWTNTQTHGECDTYFNHLNIKPASDPGPTDYDHVKGEDVLANVVVGETVTITNDKPFVVHISDGINANSWFEATQSYDQKEDKYKAEFKMPMVPEPVGALEHTSAIVDIVKLDETYSYTLNGSKLLANSTNTEAIRNVEAAQIVAKYYETESEANAAEAAEITGKAFAEKGTVINGTVPNGKYVVIKAKRADKLTNASADADAFKITLNGDNDHATKIADGGRKSYINNAAGTYEVAYKVEDVNGIKYTLTYSLKIASKDELTAEDVELVISAKKNNVDVANINTLFSNKEKEKKDLENGKVSSFMLNKYLKDGDPLVDTDTLMATEVANSTYQFTVTPTIYTDVNHETPLLPGKYIVEGFTSGSSLDDTYEFTIKIIDPEYGGSVENPKKINIKWKVVSYDKVPHWENNRFGINEGEVKPDASVAIDAFGEDSIDLKRAICNAANANGAAMTELEDGKVDFQYIKAPGADRRFEVQDELDEWKTGLPTERGDYTVYVVYDGIVQATVDVRIKEYSLGIFADESDLTFTYGHKFDLEKPFVKKNVDGENVDVEIEKDDLRCTVYRAKRVEDANHVVSWVMPTEAAEKEASKEFDSELVEDIGQLNAGYYFIEFDAELNNDDYSISPVAQPLTVNKKSLDDPSLVILIDPFNYDKATHDVVEERPNNFTVRDTDFEEDDPRGRYNISDLFKITEGGKFSAVGTYNCTFKLVDEVEPAGETQEQIAAAAERTALLSNYNGSIMNGKWHIISVRADEMGKEGINGTNWKVDAGLAWSDTKTTLYDNGKIHLEITRNADDKINKNKTVAKIKKFGVIVDKDGKIKAPATYSAVDGEGNPINPYTETEIKTAEKFLTFGNGFIEGGYTKDSTPLTCKEQTYKVNIKVKDAETGIWARPYIQYEDGTISYGPVKYVNLTNEAIDRLDLWTAGVDTGKAVRKADLTSNQTGTVAQIKKNVKSGYNTAENKYYVYARYVDLQKAGFTNVAEVADFGIVADREGAIAAPVDAANLTEAEIAAANKVLKKDKAKVVGHYNKNNTVLGVNEYAASVSLGNSDTGLWVRSYIDLGNDLVIYSEPMYIVSASKYYGNDVSGMFKTQWEAKQISETNMDYYNRLVFKQSDSTGADQAAKSVARIAAFAEKAGVEAKNVEVVNTGVIADKNNLLNSKKQMILNSDFIIGENKGKLTDVYSAKLTPKGTNEVSVRTYTTYKITGGKKDVVVTVYGDIQTFDYNEDIKHVTVVDDTEKDIYTLDDQVTLPMRASNDVYPIIP